MIKPTSPLIAGHWHLWPRIAEVSPGPAIEALIRGRGNCPASWTSEVINWNTRIRVTMAHFYGDMNKICLFGNELLVVFDRLRVMGESDPKSATHCQCGNLRDSTDLHDPRDTFHVYHMSHVRQDLIYKVMYIPSGSLPSALRGIL